MQLTPMDGSVWQDFSLWSNIEIPSDDAPRPAIFAMWDDLNPLNDNSNASAAGNVYTILT